MSFHDYLEKQRSKPVHERERIAMIGTLIGFLIFVAIWILSFREMNRSAEIPVDQPSANLNDLKENFQQGRNSIEDMMQVMPSQTAPEDMENIEEGINAPQLP